MVDRINWILQIYNRFFFLVMRHRNKQYNIKHAGHNCRLKN